MHVSEPTWPYREFGEYIRFLAKAAGLADHVEMYRLADIRQPTFSRWDRGESQPSRANLRKLATVLRVSPSKLFVAAGLMDSDELGTTGLLDPTTLPPEIREFIELCLSGKLSDDQWSYARRSLAYLTDGLRAELVKSQDKPSGRRRAG